jgi:hypothetical protein
MQKHIVNPSQPLANHRDSRSPRAPQGRGRVRPGAGARARERHSPWIRLLRRLFRIGCWAALAFGIGCAAYLTLRRSGDLRTVGWIPYPIARWADYHGRARNLFAYGILALPVMVLFRDHSLQAKWLAALGVLGTALEYGQLFIPTRWFEWQDIALSLAGLASTWVAVEGYRWCSRALARRIRGRRQLLR